MLSDDKYTMYTISPSNYIDGCSIDFIHVAPCNESSIQVMLTNI